MAGLIPTGELLRLELPAEPAFVGVARTVVAAVASIHDIDEDRLEDLRVAVSEAVTNAVEAHRRDGSEERVVLTCRTDAVQLEVCVADRGGGFDPDGVPAAPGPDGAPTAASERGWGVQLIQALVDDVTFRRTEEGTAVDLVVRFERTEATD